MIAYKFNIIFQKHFKIIFVSFWIEDDCSQYYLSIHYLKPLRTHKFWKVIICLINRHAYAFLHSFIVVIQRIIGKHMDLDKHSYNWKTLKTLKTYVVEVWFRYGFSHSIRIWSKNIKENIFSKTHCMIFLQYTGYPLMG